MKSPAVARPQVMGLLARVRMAECLILDPPYAVSFGGSGRLLGCGEELGERLGERLRMGQRGGVPGTGDLVYP